MHPFYMHTFVCGESAWQDTLNSGAVKEILVEKKENVCGEELTLYELFYESLGNVLYCKDAFYNSTAVYIRNIPDMGLQF